MTTIDKPGMHKVRYNFLMALPLYLFFTSFPSWNRSFCVLCVTVPRLLYSCVCRDFLRKRRDSEIVRYL